MSIQIDRFQTEDLINNNNDVMVVDKQKDKLIAKISVGNKVENRLLAEQFITLIESAVENGDLKL